jgi:hypothetical protein
LHNPDAWAGTRRCDSLAVGLGRLGAEAERWREQGMQRISLVSTEDGTW